MQGFPETRKLFQGFLQGKQIEKGWSKLMWFGQLRRNAAKRTCFTAYGEV